MSYIRKAIYETKLGQYFSLIFPVCMALSCGKPANKITIKVDFNGDTYLDEMVIEGLLPHSWYPITVRLSDPDGELGPTHQLGKFKGKFLKVESTITSESTDFEITTGKKVYNVSIPSPSGE